ncbi:MAG TPA: divalent metal cation transporter [Opitutaceae bacterium]|nr:divalent metal cation transporter [Opitutaceae bacterium]
MPDLTAPKSTRPGGKPLCKTDGYSAARFFRSLGPGLVTGAADDDPSGIATYSIAGAQLGTAMLWTAWVTWPLMAAVPFMCARVGMVTGMGLARALKRKIPRPLVVAAVGALTIANTINIAADLAGMADAAVDLVGGRPVLFAAVLGAAIAIVTVGCTYARFAAILKWLAASLLAYVATAFITRPDWGAVWRALVPAWPHGRDAWATLVALFGTTISPYLFFWQASQEVEEEKGQERRNIGARSGASKAELMDRRVDVVAGTFLSNAVMFFVILTCAMTLHRAGVRNIETSHQAAEALRPLAGRAAAALYTVGLVTVGLLAIPTLAGSSAYALAETFNWRQGLGERFAEAREFYLVVLGSIAAGIALVAVHISPVKALFWSAVINGVLAPFLLGGLLVVACDRKLMCGQPTPLAARIIVGAAMVVMFGAAAAMFLV